MSVCYQATVAGLTPHLVDTKQLLPVDSLKEQVPELHIFSEDLVDQLLSTAPVVCGQHTRNGFGDILIQRPHSTM